MKLMLKNRPRINTDGHGSGDFFICVYMCPSVVKKFLLFCPLLFTVYSAFSADAPPMPAIIATTNGTRTNHAGVSMCWGVTNVPSNCAPTQFRVWWGCQPGLYDSFQDVGTNQWFKFTNARPGRSYWFSVTASNVCGTNTNFYNEIAFRGMCVNDVDQLLFFNGFSPTNPP
jgi:hypothetical protein